MNFEAIVFDFDYTLGDSTKGITMSINYALTQLGYEPSDLESIRKTIGLSMKETFIRLTQINNDEQSDKFIRLFREKADIVMTECTELLPYALDTLRQAKANNIKTGIVTTKYHYRINQILDKFNAVSLIDIIVGSEDVKFEKPNPEGLIYAMNEINVRKERALYVGDSIVDAETAKLAGVSFIGVTTGTTTEVEFSKFPHIKIIDNLSQLQSIPSLRHIN
jgi:phosphoglycolate phosphatase